MAIKSLFGSRMHSNSRKPFSVHQGFKFCFRATNLSTVEEGGAHVLKERQSEEETKEVIIGIIRLLVCR